MQELLEELVEKIAEYRSSLATVEAALESDPDEDQLIRLKKDLLEVIALTEDMVRFKRNEEGQLAAVADLGSSSIVQGEDEQAGDSTTQPEEGTKGQVAYTYSSLIGRTCLASTGSEKLFGEIVKIKRSSAERDSSTGGSSGGGVLIVVDFFRSAWAKSSGSVSRLELPPDSIQVLPSVRNLNVGSKCQAVASEDGRLHGCVVEAVYSSKGVVEGYKVKFHGLGTIEKLKPDRLFVPQASPSGGGDKERKKKPVKEIVTPGGYRLPEYLQVKPTDSQHQIAAKRRKISLLKKEQRKEQVEEVAKERQSSWLSHARKVTSKQSVPARSSIFATPENPLAKVGVTNSGKGMTTFMTRQRHDYEDSDS